MCIPTREAIGWHHICTLEDWLEIAVEPSLVNGTKPPIGWTKVGEESLHLDATALVWGHIPTYGQMIKLVGHMTGAAVKGVPAKKDIYNQLIDLVVPDELKERARAHVKTKKGQAAEDEYDSDFSELVSELAQDEQNHNEIQEYRDKKKKQRLKQKMAKPVDQPLEGEKKRKGKGKAKAKPKAKPKPKAKGKVLNKFMKHAQAKLKASKEAKDTVEGMDIDAKVPQEGVTMGPPESEGRAGEASSSTPLLQPPHPMETGEGDATMGPPKGKADDPMETGEDANMEAQPSAPQPETMEMSQPPPDTQPGASASAPRPVVPGKPRADKRKSPEEILEPLQPPGCRFGVSYQDHRFTSVWKGEHRELAGDKGNRRFSRTFYKARTWQEALKAVHKHCWEKWMELKATYPLGAGQDEQVPGEIPDSVLEQLKPTIDSLPAITRYGQS